LCYPLSRSLSPKERGNLDKRGLRIMFVVYNLSDKADRSDGADP